MLLPTFETPTVTGWGFLFYTFEVLFDKLDFMIRAISFLLNTGILNSTKELFLKDYSSNLYHIEHFSRYKDNNNEGYQQVFNDFLFGFRITRNVKKDKKGELLSHTMKWIKTSDDINAVDRFAAELKDNEITQENKTMTSLASKILFLNNPCEITPYDSLVRIALGLDNSKVTYEEFIKRFQNFQKQYEQNNDFNTYYDSISPFALAVEKEFKIPNSEKIRKNRFTDLLLWTVGNVNIKGKLK